MPGRLPRPGLLGQGNLPSTLGAMLFSTLGTVLLTCAFGSLVYLSSPVESFAYQVFWGSDEAISTLNAEHAARFIEETGLLIALWAAVAGCIASALALDAALFLFPRAQAKWLLGGFIAAYLFLVGPLGLLPAGSSLNSASNITVFNVVYGAVGFLLAGGATGVFLAWSQFQLFLAKTAWGYWVMPEHLRHSRPSGEDRHRSSPLRLPAAEFRLELEPELKAAHRQIGRNTVLFVFLGVLSWISLEGDVDLVRKGLTVFWFVVAAKYALVYAGGWTYRRPGGGVELTVDERGIVMELGTVAWHEAGRLWVAGESGNAVAMEVPEPVDRRIHKGLPIIHRLLNLGAMRFKRKHIGMHTIVIETEFLDTTAPELLAAIEDRRPRRIQWRPAS